MSQYSNLLRSTRIPKPGIDELVVSPGSRHIVIQRKGTFYKLDVLTADGGTVPLAQLHGALQSIVDQADASPAPPDEAVGLLTGLDRDSWSTLREKLSTSDPANAESLAVRCSWETH